jgi:NAD(P)H-dependent FMN reductase
LIQLLTICGSLRRESASGALLQKLADAAPLGVTVRLFDQLEAVPPFNPDRENEPVPAPVAALRSHVAGADAVIFSTPEYAHGVPGVLKNALDWLVGSGELYEKPVLIVHPTTRGEYARASLLETLKIMGTRAMPERILGGEDQDAIAKLFGDMREAVKLRESGPTDFGRA